MLPKDPFSIAPPVLGEPCSTEGGVQEVVCGRGWMDQTGFEANKAEGERGEKQRPAADQALPGLHPPGMMGANPTGRKPALHSLCLGRESPGPDESCDDGGW